MANPTRDTTAGRVYNDLRNPARRNSRSADEVMVEYVLERVPLPPGLIAPGPGALHPAARPVRMRAEPAY
jgi:hypothetical protein